MIAEKTKEIVNVGTGEFSIDRKVNKILVEFITVTYDLLRNC